MTLQLLDNTPWHSLAGPFAERTIELGDYDGVFEAGRARTICSSVGRQLNETRAFP